MSSARFDSQGEPITGYRLLERLGSGGFGEVWKAEAPGGIFKAIKIIFGDIRSKDADSSRFAEQELKALKRVKQVRHPYLLALDRYDIVDGRLMIVMELADCNLWDRFRECRKRNLPGIPREELLRYMAEASEVLDLMNDQFQLQHLDIKPQNLFLLYNHVKVADFGQVKDLEGMVASVTGGITPVYAAPETFDGFVSRFCDQYSLACVYQELLTGVRPFDGNSMQQLLMQHLQHAPNLQPSPPGDRPALLRALAKKPDDRFPSCLALVRALIDGTEGGPKGSAFGFAVPTLPPPAAAPSPVPAAPPVSPPNLEESARIEVFLTNRPADPPKPADPAPASQVPQPATNPASQSIARPPAPSAPSNLPPLKTSSAAIPYPSGRVGGPGSALGPLPPLVPPGSPAMYSASGIVPLGELTPQPRSGLTDTVLPPERVAPPAERGDGPLRPALVIGLGYTGLRVLQRLNRDLTDRFGPPERRPVVRTLYIDTDGDALTGATIDRPTGGRAGLLPETVFAAKLNRAAHYLKPRLNGRSLVEGWFDPQLLYRLPRNPLTLGLRLFGRLAFCDHYRGLMQKLQAEIDAVLDPAAMDETRAATGLDLRTNRPRVYVVCGLGGGTGSGMFLDLAYAVRARLKRIGYASPDVVGVLLVPTERPTGGADPQSQANTYAALTELRHFARPGTVYTANFDDRGATVADPDPPFAHVYLLPGLDPRPTGIGAGSGAWTAAARPADVPLPPPSLGRPAPSRRPGRLADDADPDPCGAVADFLRLDLFSLFGPVAEDVRGPDKANRLAAGHVRTFGLVRFGWPRGEVVGRAVRAVAHQMVNRWVSPDPTRVRQVIPGWAAERWTRLGLDPEKLVAHFRTAADKALGGRVEDVISATVDPLVPKGWLARLPDPERLSVVVDHLLQLVGRPNPPAGTPPSEVERTLRTLATDAARVAVADAVGLVLELVEDPGFRPAGAEEATRQLLAVLDRTKSQFETQVAELETAAAFAYQTLVGYAYFQKGMRKPTPADVGDALRNYPRSQYQALVYRGVVHLYHALREPLIETLNRVAGCRARVEGLVELFPTDDDAPPAPRPGPREMLPVGCPTTDAAAERFLGSLTQDDTIALEHAVEAGLVREFGGLFQACLNQTDGPEKLVRVIREGCRAYLDERLGEVDFAEMLGRFFGPGAVGRGLAGAFEDADPAFVAGGPWARAEVPVFACPVGEGGDPIRQLATQVLPPNTGDAPVADEVVLYREYPDVPLTAFPHLGPTWQAAYRAAPDAQQCPPHARLDIDRWGDVDAE